MLTAAPDPKLEQLGASEAGGRSSVVEHLRRRGVSDIVLDTTGESLEVRSDDGEKITVLLERRLDDLCDGCVLITEFEHR
jgi:hypothetical protein